MDTYGYLWTDISADISFFCVKCGMYFKGDFDKIIVFCRAFGVYDGHLWTVKDTKGQVYIGGCFFFLRKTLGSMAPLLSTVSFS